MAWKDTQIKSRIIDKYYTIIEEYFKQIEKLHLSNNEVDIQSCMMIGLNSIHRVFEYVLMKTKNIEKAYYYSQRTYFYYIQYIGQIYETNLQNALNQGDAVLFIYKKTIFELQNGEDNKIFDTITNIMTFDEEITNINDKEYYEWLSKLSNLIHVFFYWKNVDFSFNNRCDLMKMLLKKYMIHIDSTSSAISYLEILHEKIDMNYTTYTDLLTELLDFQLNSTNMLAQDSLSQCDFFLKFYIEDTVLYENLENNNMKEVVKWIYKPLASHF